MVEPHDVSSAEIVPSPNATRQRRVRDRWDVLVVIALGGLLGTAARHGIDLWWPRTPHTFPWSTLLTNTIGCLLIGALMVVLTETVHSHRLVRPFLGVGVLGGFTTFSTYTSDTAHLVLAGRPRLALIYLLATVTAALAAVLLGARATSTLLRATGRTRTPARHQGVPR